MNKEILLLATAAMIVLTANTRAQNVPSYVPTDGLVGWWPFNGNANDESGHGNDGVVNGASITIDRFGNSNDAYSFNGISDFIQINDNSSLDLESTLSISVWSRHSSACSNCSGWILGKGVNSTNSGYLIGQGLSYNQNGYDGYRFIGGSIGSQSWEGHTQSEEINGTIWNHMVIVFDNLNLRMYVNGTLDVTYTSNFMLSQNDSPLLFGAITDAPTAGHYNGEIDDAGIWNRALTEQEITALFNASDCTNNTTITPTINSTNIGSTASFTATTADPAPSFIWQSDLGQGFQTLNDYGQYSGVSTAELSVSNVQLSEHLQQVRAISTSGNCVDTSNVAIINILDTCITNISVYDTLFTSVTDTLVIITQITGINPIDIQNTIKVFPNPTSTHITIDYGNYSAMSGYSLRITNSLGAEVFNTSINQQTSYIDLGSWTGNGLYFVHIIDPQGNTMDIRKIVLQ